MKLTKYWLPYLVFLITLSNLLSYANLAVNADSKTLRFKINDDNLFLKYDSLIEKELKGGEKDSYKIVLKDNQFLHIIAEQQGIDVALELFFNKTSLVQIDSPNGASGTEELFWISEHAGEYELQVRSDNKDAVAANYKLHIEEMRPTTSNDISFIKSQSDFLKGVELGYINATPESRLKGIEKFQGAYELFKQQNNKYKEALCLLSIGEVYYYNYEYNKSLEILTQALTAYYSLNFKEDLGKTLFRIGGCHYALSNFEQSLIFYNQAYSLMNEKGDQSIRISILRDIATIYSDLGEREKAISFYKKGLNIAEIQGNLSAKLQILNPMSAVAFNNGDFIKSSDYANQALSIAIEINNLVEQSYALNSIAATYYTTGEMQKGLDYAFKAFQVAEASGDKQCELTSLTNLATIYKISKLPERSMQFYVKALSMATQTSDLRSEAKILNNIGLCYYDLKNYESALEYYNKSLAKRLANKDIAGESIVLNNIGAVYHSLGKLEDALLYYQKSLEIDERIGRRESVEVAQSLYNIGDIYLELNKKEKALDFFNQSLAIAGKQNDSNLEMNIYYKQAIIEDSNGKIAEASTKMLRAIELAEKVRQNLNVQDLRISYFASSQKYYKYTMSLLMKMHENNPKLNYNELAFNINERRIARSLLEIITERKSNNFNGVDSKLILNRENIKSLINIQYEKMTSLLTKKDNNKEKESVEAIINRLKTELDVIESQIQEESTHYNNFILAKPNSLKEIQEKILDKDTTLLEYSLGNDNSYLWVVTQSSIDSFPLPKQDELEKLVRDYFKYLLNPSIKSSTESQEERLEREKRDNEFQKVALSLSQMLLGEASSHLNSKRLLIVGDGILQHLPFGSLPLPGEPSKKFTSANIPLITKYEILNLPSASTMAVLNNEFGDRKPAEKSIAMIADPVFEGSDERIANNKLKPDNTVAGLDSITRSVIIEDSERSGLSFKRLKFVRQEANKILSLTGNDHKVALDFDANLNTVLSSDLEKYRIVHFATHGFFNPIHPELSGIVLSLYDEVGKEQAGFLTLNQILNLKLPAELVVLSACQTGLGKEIKGEGIVGITRGFMYAGAARVMYSLWSVNDASTAELMERFYHGMLKDGLKPASALRAAQLSMYQDKRFNQPYYWAAFQIQGIW